MLVPMSWLCEFVDVRGAASEVAQALTLAGIEVDAIRSVGVFHPQVVAGRVTEYRDASDRTGLKLIEVAVAPDRIVSAVSTAPNLGPDSVGKHVAVALEGAIVLSADDGRRPVLVQAGERYGHLSQAVLLSERELGTGDDHRGIVYVDAVRPGTPLRDVIQAAGGWQADDVLEIAILPNISRCQSIIGVAREVSALMGAKLVSRPASAILAVDRRSDLEEGPFDRALVRRFSTALISGVTIASSPAAIQRKLVLAGLNPINNVVDASNLVMLEMGQPTHAYDVDRLASTSLGVRLSRSGETLHVLNQESGAPPLTIPAGVPLIVCADRPVAIAGNIGGTDTAIADTTTRLLLESANFEYVAIRKGQALSKIQTEASGRFSRGVDPALTLPAIALVLALLRQTCPNAAVEWIEDCSGGAENRQLVIALTTAAVNQSLGAELDTATCLASLRATGIACDLDESGHGVVAVVTSAREDIEGPWDLIEEIARLHGFNNIAPTLPTDEPPWRPESNTRANRERIRDGMVRLGLQEVLTYSMTSATVESRLNLQPPQTPPSYVTILNPHSAERDVMRRTLLPEMLRCVALNLRRRGSCHIFEIGNVYLPERPGVAPGLPFESLRLGIAMTGSVDTVSMHQPDPRPAGYFDIANTVKAAFDCVHVEDFRLRRGEAPPFQVNACGEIVLDGEAIGHVGIVHPRIARAFDIGQTVVAAELALDLLVAREFRQRISKDLSTLPSMELDISVVVKRGLSAGDLIAAVHAVGIAELADVTVFDVFMGEGLGADVKAVGLRLTLAAPDRTLTVADERDVAQRVLAHLHERFGAVLRS